MASGELPPLLARHFCRCLLSLLRLRAGVNFLLFATFDRDVEDATQEVWASFHRHKLPAIWPNKASSLERAGSRGKLFFARIKWCQSVSWNNGRVMVGFESTFCKPFELDEIFGVEYLNGVAGSHKAALRSNFGYLIPSYLESSAT